jgi:hypothetical protein
MDVYSYILMESSDLFSPLLGSVLNTRSSWYFPLHHHINAFFSKKQSPRMQIESSFSLVHLPTQQNYCCLLRLFLCIIFHSTLLQAHHQFSPDERWPFFPSMILTCIGHAKMPWNLTIHKSSPSFLLRETVKYVDDPGLA